MKRIVYFLIPLSLTLMISSCGLLTSDTRSLKLAIKKYQNHLSDGQYDDATNMCDAEKFLWLKDGEEAEKATKSGKSRKSKSSRRRAPKQKKGSAAAKAFHDSIKKLDGSDKVMIEITTITELKPGFFTVIGYMQVRQIESGALRSIKWKMTMKWVKTGTGWKMIEFKERGGRESFRS
jgi:hypothetical protein